MNRKSQAFTTMQKEIDRLRSINAELLEACKDALRFAQDVNSFEEEKDPYSWRIIKRLEKAISHSEGKEEGNG